MEFCRYCGAKIMDDSKFCSKCGKNIEPSSGNVSDESRKESVYDEFLQSLVNDSTAGKPLNNTKQGVDNYGLNIKPGYEYHESGKKHKSKKKDKIKRIAEISVPGLVGFLIQQGIMLFCNDFYHDEFCEYDEFYGEYWYSYFCWDDFWLLFSLVTVFCIGVTILLRYVFLRKDRKALTSKARRKAIILDLIITLYAYCCETAIGVYVQEWYLWAVETIAVIWLIFLLGHSIPAILFTKFYGKKKFDATETGTFENSSKPMNTAELLANNMIYLSSDEISDYEKDMYLQTVVSAAELRNKNT